MPKLPKWVPVSDCNKIFSLIKKAGGESRLVGGCVRDILLGKSHSDIDIATTATPDVVMSVLKNAEIKVIPTGLKHGTVTAVLNEKHYEITTLRKDIETDGRHAVVEFTDSWKEDAKRRDFTINAMSMDLQGEVHDYFDGQKDLQSKLVKFVGNPEKRIEEDYLRILRYFRFISYFGDQDIHKSSLKACQNLAKGLKKISGERIRIEMLKILTSPFAVRAFILMNEGGVLEVLGVKGLTDKFHNYIFTENPYINLAAILRAAGYKKLDVSRLATRWRLSKKEKFNLEQLVVMKDVALELPLVFQRRATYVYGKEAYVDCIKLLNIESPSIVCKQLVERANAWEMPEFKIDGENIVKLGYNGPQIGKMLRKLHQMWIDSDFELSKEQLLSRAKNDS